MALRQIGQEGVRLSEGSARHGSSLDAVAALLDWGEIDGALNDIFAAAKGERGCCLAGSCPHPWCRRLPH